MTCPGAAPSPNDHVLSASAVSRESLISIAGKLVPVSVDDHDIELPDL